MPRPLEMSHGHDRDVVADVQAVGGGVEAHVEGDGLPVEELPQLLLVGNLLDKAPFLEDIERVGHVNDLPFFTSGTAKG